MIIAAIPTGARLLSWVRGYCFFFVFSIAFSPNNVAQFLLRRLKSAIAEGQEHIKVFEEFTEDLAASHDTQLDAWRKMILEYEAGGMSVNEKSPYDIDGDGNVVQGMVK